jgi:hypothetical protein
LTETLSEVILGAAAVATSVLVLALPIYYGWKLVASFRRKTAHWLPILALSLWLSQWPFAILSAAGCLGGGCAGDPTRNWLGLLGVLAYNLSAAVWLWRRSAAQVAQ